MYYDTVQTHDTTWGTRNLLHILYVGLVWSKKSGTGSVCLLWRKDNRKILKYKLKEIKWV